MRVGDSNARDLLVSSPSHGSRVSLQGGEFNLEQQQKVFDDRNGAAANLSCLPDSVEGRENAAAAASGPDLNDVPTTSSRPQTSMGLSSLLGVITRRKLPVAIARREGAARGLQGSLAVREAESKARGASPSLSAALRQQGSSRTIREAAEGGAERSSIASCGYRRPPVAHQGSKRAGTSRPGEAEIVVSSGSGQRG